MIARLWDAMWPNIFAPSAFTLAGIGISHLRTRVHLARHHEDTKVHVEGILSDHHESITSYLDSKLAAHCSDIKDHVTTVATKEGK